MRLWTLDLQYIDSKGLVALWREALLALHVLTGRTKGYKHHPQLKMFSLDKDIAYQQICNYLHIVYNESITRGYKFDKNKIPLPYTHTHPLETSAKQLAFEFAHLQTKLQTRDIHTHTRNILVRDVKAGKVFSIVNYHPSYEAKIIKS